MKTRILQKTVAGVHYVTIPEKLRKALGWKKSDIIAIICKDDTLHLKRIAKADEDDILETTL